MFKDFCLKDNLESLPISAKLVEYSNLSENRFHTPGHMGNNSGVGEILNPQFDVTEVWELDNLLAPTGVISKSQQKVASIYNANHAYYVTSGATTAILSALHTLKGKGRVAILRSSHNSIYNGLELFEIKPYIIENIDGFGKTKTLNYDMIKESLKEEDICAYFLTYPDYVGKVFNIKEIAREIKNAGKLLYVDEAHGAHFAFSNSLPDCACNYADVVICSNHKTLGALTAGAMLLLNNESLKESLERSYSLLHTTSPSYLIMASLEMSVVAYDKCRGELGELISYMKELRESLEQQGVKLTPSGDLTRLAVDCEQMGISGKELDGKLEEIGVFCEYSSLTEIVFIITLSHQREQIEKLAQSIVKLSKECEKIEFRKYEFPRGERVLSYEKAVTSECEEIEISKAIGRVSGRNFGIYPPCLPLSVAGEVITKQIIDYLNIGFDYYNIKDKKVRVIK